MAGSLRLVAHSLSGRLLLLTLLYVLISEAVISIPTIARYHRELLDTHIESAEIAILPFTEIGGEQFSPGLRRQLLMRAGADAVMLKRRDQRELFLVQGMPEKLDRTIDLSKPGLWYEIGEALNCLFMGGDRMLRIIAATQIPRAETVEVIVGEAPIRASLLVYSERTLLVGLLISVVAAVLVFLSLYFVLVQPMRRITHAMVRFRENPEDPSRIVAATARRDEIGTAERELAAMQRDIYGSLQQKTRLAALGAAVAKIQHDLRNILSSAQLASERLTAIDDPVVKRLTPRLVASLDRAVSLATNTLRYGRADERAPERRALLLAPIVNEVGEAVRLATALSFENRVDPDLKVNADAEQLHRILLNLVRNAAEALQARQNGTISVGAMRENGGVRISVCDNGPGVPEAMREKLFQPFATAAKPGGSGLGLSIARDLARLHGGDVRLAETGALGTTFCVYLPDRT
ncbi:MAG TPA: HAMP domain-containing sensor histidine kinase [Rhizomicrobium sp.]|nr:HAMP domain-containing sensor histidine kinase [Rhizomicrobium sp.]